jgi:succinoglycan biosynthesis transport protein ExoP
VVDTSAELGRGGLPARSAALDRPFGNVVPAWEREIIESEQGSQGWRILEYLRILYKHKWVVTGTLATGLALGLAFILLIPRTYTAKTVLDVDPQTPNVSGLSDLEPVSNAMRDDTFFQTQYGLLKSFTLRQRVAESLNLVNDVNFLKVTGLKVDPTYTSASPPWLMKYLKDHLRVDPTRGSQLVEVSFESPDPGQSAKIANAYADNFIRANLDRRYQATAYARNFLEQRINELKAKVEDSERAMVQYATKNGMIQVGVTGMGPSDAFQPEPLVVEALDNFDNELTKIRANKIVAQGRYDSAKDSTGIQSPDIIGDYAVANLRAQRANLAAQYIQQSKLFKPDYPAQQQLKAQIDQMDQEIDKQSNAIRGALKTNLNAADEQASQMLALEDRMKSDVLKERQQEIQYNELQREVATNLILYDGLLQRYKEVGIAGGSIANNISVVDPARSPEKPSQPEPVKDMAIAGVGGLGLGIALAFLLETMDQAVRKPGDVETKLGLPVLGSVPLLAKGLQPLEALADQRSAFSESYNSIQTNLAFATKDGAPRVLAVTSARPEEGKSTTSFALATGFARSGLRVLLVDLDLRNPSLHKVVGSDNRVGVSNLLTGAVRLEDAVQPTKWESLFAIPSGPLPPSPAELQIGPRLAAFIRDASERYDMVVLDSPPVMGLADAPLISSVAAGTLLTVEAGRTSRAQARSAIKRLRLANAHLVGSILTKFDASRMAYGYGYAYAYEYEYNYQYGRKDKITDKGGFLSGSRTSVADDDRPTV